jgi:cytochrome c-type biogenesis protein CcmH
MSVFWIGAGVLLAVALVFLLKPLLGQPRMPKLSAAQAREQLESLDLLVSLGKLDAASAAAKREIISAALLAAVDGEKSPAARGSFKTAIAASVLLVLSAVGLYDHLGNPLAMSADALKPLAQAEPSAAGEPSPHSPGDMQKAIDELKSKLRKDQSDIEGWLLLARSYYSVQQFDDQLAATTTALELAPENPEVMIEHAEALALAKFDRRLSGEPEALLQKALTIEPKAQKALWLTGIAALQRGDQARAIEIWTGLKALLDPGSSVMASLDEQLARAQAELAGSGDAPVDAPSASTEPSAAPAATDGASLTVTVDLAPEFKAQIPPNATLFIFARAESGPPMPLAIERRAASGFPVTVVLDDSKSMLPEMKLSLFPRVVVGARISRSGNAQAQPGDWQHLSAAIEPASQRSIAITIDQVVK